MNDRPESSASFWTRSWACILALSFLAAPSRADEEPWPPPEGAHVLRAILKAQLEDNLLPLREEELVVALKDPPQALVVVFGNPNWLSHFKVPRILKDFVENGGALLVVTDETTPGSLMDAFGVGVSGVFLKAGHDDDKYQELDECILVREFSPHPIFAGVGAVATNKPSFLIAPPANGTLKILAQFPKLTKVETPRFHNREPRFRLPAENDREPRFKLAAGNEVGQGRVLVVADHSVFINQMLLQKDSNNLTFASNCIDWLTEKKDGGRRKRVLFVENGVVVTDFRASLKPLPRPRLPSLGQLAAAAVPVAEKALDNLEKEDFFNRQAAEGEDFLGAHRPEVIPCLIALATFVLLCVVGLRLGFPRPVFVLNRLAAALGRETGYQLGLRKRPTDPVAPRAAVRSRPEAMVREGRFWEAVHYLAGRLGPAPGARAARLRRRGATAKPISAQQFRDFLREYEAARKAVAARRPADGAPPS